MPFAQLNGFRMFYREGGVGDALVFIHGGIASLARTLKDHDEYGWGSLDMFFAAHFRYVNYDRRGCRLSSCPDQGYELTNQAEDLRALLDEVRPRDGDRALRRLGGRREAGVVGE